MIDEALLQGHCSGRPWCSESTAKSTAWMMRRRQHRSGSAASPGHPAAPARGVTAGRPARGRTLLGTTLFVLGFSLVFATEGLAFGGLGLVLVRHQAGVTQIQPGIDDRTQVAKLLGSPSTVATFNDKTWYYISKKTSRIAFWDPTVLDQEVLMVKFLDGGSH